MASKACFVIAALGLMEACGPSVAREPRPAPAPPPSAAPAQQPLAVVSPPRFATGRSAYLITSTATVGFGTSDSAARQDTLVTTVAIRYEVTSTSQGLDLQGSIVTRRVSSTAAMRTQTIEPPDPIPFAATVDTAVSTVRFASDSAAASPTVCPTPHAGSLAIVRQFFLSIPRSMTPGATWTDTVASTACRGEIPVTTTTVRHFTVTLKSASSQQAPRIVVTRASTADLLGQALHRGQPVGLHGSGTGAYEDAYDAYSGRLLSSAGVSDVTVAVGPPGRETTVREHVDQHVTPAAP